MKFSVLGSGSKGNCTLVESGSTRLLIDNGFSGKEIIGRLTRLGLVPEMLTALVITHEHDDHIKGVGVLARRLNLPVYANGATHRAAAHRIGPLPVHREFGTGEPFVIGDLHIHPFSVSHDTADPVGFVVSDGTSRLGYCTDTGKITQLIKHHLQQCQALILEANHDVQMLQEGPYPLALKQRVLSSRGHLANGDSVDLAALLAEHHLQLLVLAHLSAINNHPDLVQEEVRRRLRPKHSSLQVLLAGQLQTCPLLEITS
jgi:phosphoribosyl 1,2-cyclic phosphodiesterase